MGLREDAIAAAAAALEVRKTLARGVLAARLSPAEVDTLDVEATTSDLVVFSDGTIHLAVSDKTDPQVVRLVEPTGNGGWRRLGGNVSDLPALGSMLETEG